jgi:hypothetical protein
MRLITTIVPAADLPQGGSLTKNRRSGKMRSRERQRRNRRLKHMYQKLEKKIEKQNAYGVKDLTAYNAVERIRTGGRAAIVLK